MSARNTSTFVIGDKVVIGNGSAWSGFTGVIWAFKTSGTTAGTIFVDLQLTKGQTLRQQFHRTIVHRAK